MTQTLSISAFIGSGLLMIPFVFYSLMYRGMVGSLLTGGVLIVFFVSMYRLRKEGLRTLLVISVCSNGAPVASDVVPHYCFGFFICWSSGVGAICLRYVNVANDTNQSGLKTINHLVVVMFYFAISQSNFLRKPLAHTVAEIP